MLKILVRKEILAHLLSYRFVLTFSLFFVLVVSSVQIIALTYDRQVASYATARRAEEEKLKETGDFRSLRRTGFRAEKPPNPLSVFAVGLEREMSRSLYVSRSQEVKLGRSKYANPLFTLFSAPDLVYIVNIVGSLLALLFAFDAVCGEKQEGTLRLIMANAVPRDLILIAKWIGGYTVLILTFLTAILIALLFAQLTTALRFTTAEWSAFALILGVAALYISVFYALGLMVSTLTHRAATSLVLSFLIWVLLVLVIPNTAPILARALAPVPSGGVVAGQRQAIHRRIWDEMHARPRGSREEHRQMHDEATELISEETGKVLSAYLQKVDAQIQLSILLARISPSANYVYATASLGGSGPGNFASMREVIQRYRHEVLQWWDTEWQARRASSEGAATPEERQEIRDAPVDPDDMPQFSLERGGLGDVLLSSQTDLVLLVVLNVGFFLAAYMRFLRYDLME